jgi:hypothetical protein
LGFLTAVARRPHLSDDRRHNFSPGNEGLVLANDILMPIMGFVSCGCRINIRNQGEQRQLDLQSL